MFDSNDVNKKLTELREKIKAAKVKSAHNVAEEVMRLSQMEVPHDTGMLQNSGAIQDKDDEVIVGYNKVYAARLHEHPEYHFQKGRKGKYLEDPIKRNLDVFRKYFGEQLVSIIK